MNAETVKRWIPLCAASIAEQRDYLTQLDAAIGDADHGANMTRGFAAVEEKLAALDGGVTPGKVLITAGSTLVSTVGGASGPLWGTALRRAGRSLGDAEAIDPARLADAMEAAVAGVVELGAAEPGDKTMVDALMPAVEALQRAQNDGAELNAALEQSAAAARKGMEDTVPLVARKGRASYLGERSAGHQDPGATSSYLLVQAAVDTFG